MKARGALSWLRKEGIDTGIDVGAGARVFSSISAPHIMADAMALGDTAMGDAMALGGTAMDDAMVMSDTVIEGTITVVTVGPTAVLTARAGERGAGVAA